jgi:hypothetical protein
MRCKRIASASQVRILPPPLTTAPGSDEPGAVRFALLSSGLALAVIAHQLWWEGPEVPSKHFAVVVLALAVLARPSSVALLALLLGAEAVVVWDDMPGAGSHTLLLGVVAAATAGHVGWQLARRRRLPAPAELAARMAPLLAGTLVVLYAAAMLAKLNSGFVDPERSCAAALVGQVTWWNPTLIGDWAAWPAIVGTLAAEASLAVLLLVRRTRPAALVLGTGFHLVLALAGNVPFTALVLALYAGLLPDATALRLAPLVRRPGRTLPVLAATGRVRPGRRTSCGSRRSCSAWSCSRSPSGGTRRPGASATASSPPSLQRCCSSCSTPRRRTSA